MEHDRCILSNEYYRGGNLGTHNYLFFITHNKLLREVIFFYPRAQLNMKFIVTITHAKSLVKKKQKQKSLEIYMYQHTYLAIDIY